MSAKRVYVFNAPIITNYGLYRYSKISVAEASILAKGASLGGNLVSAVGHEATAKLLSRLLGVEIPVNRIFAKMEPGEVAIVFRVLQRLPEGKVLSEEELQQIPYEIGLLERLE